MSPGGSRSTTRRRQQAPKPKRISEYLAYFGLGPQEMESREEIVLNRRSPTSPLRPSERLRLLGTTIQDPWGATAALPETAIRAGRRLRRVLELPRDQPLVDLVMHTVPVGAARRHMRGFADTWIVLHALAACVVRAGRTPRGGARLRTSGMRIEYPACDAFEKWKAACDALEDLDDTLVAEGLRERTVASREAPAIVRRTEAARRGRPPMARTQANDVRDLLVRLDTCLTAKEIAFELSKSGVQIGNVRYAAQEAVHRFPGEIATDVHEGRSVFGPTAKVRQLTARLPRQSPT